MEANPSEYSTFQDDVGDKCFRRRKAVHFACLSLSSFNCKSCGLFQFMWKRLGSRPCSDRTKALLLELFKRNMFCDGREGASFVKKLSFLNAANPQIFIGHHSCSWAQKWQSFNENSLSRLQFDEWWGSSILILREGWRFCDCNVRRFLGCVWKPVILSGPQVGKQCSRPVGNFSSTNTPSLFDLSCSISSPQSMVWNEKTLGCWHFSRAHVRTIEPLIRT